jgi:hypothetical protein
MIEAPTETFFHEDPVGELDDALRSPFIVSVTPFSSAPEMSNAGMPGSSSRTKSGRSLCQSLVANGATHEQRLRIELRGQVEFVVQALRDYARMNEGGGYDFWTVMTAMGPSIMLQQWEAAGGDPAGLPGLLGFLSSHHHAALPTNWISSQIVADVTTDAGRPIQPGDSMDGELLSVAIPISNFVVTDKSTAGADRLNPACSGTIHSYEDVVPPLIATTTSRWSSRPTRGLTRHSTAASASPAATSSRSSTRRFLSSYTALGSSSGA